MIDEDEEEEDPAAEWDADDGDDLEPYFMAFFRGKFSARKLRLALCGCCRLQWHALGDVSRRALETAERHADGLATNEELDAVREQAWEHIGTGAGVAVAKVCYHPHYTYQLDSAHEIAGYQTPDEPTADPYKACRDIVRCVTGNPHRPVAFDPAWRTSTAVALAGRMYEAHDFTAMPILADALQDAGCDSDVLLAHCRGDSPHVRGCWVVDLVLGKA